MRRIKATTTRTEKAAPTLSVQVQALHRQCGLLSAALVELQAAAERADTERAACRCQAPGHRAARTG